MHTFRWVGCSLTFLIRSYVSEPDTTILNPAHACIETRGQKYPLSCLTLKWSNFFPYPDLLLCINLHYKILTTSINKSRSCSLAPSMLAVHAVYEYGFLSFLFIYLFIFFVGLKLLMRCWWFSIHRKQIYFVDKREGAGKGAGQSKCVQNEIVDNNSLSSKECRWRNELQHGMMIFKFIPHFMCCISSSETTLDENN